MYLGDVRFWGNTEDSTRIIAQVTPQMKQFYVSCMLLCAIKGESRKKLYNRILQRLHFCMRALFPITDYY